MVAEGLQVLAAAVLGAVATVAIERGLQPRPRWRRPGAAWALHTGVWLVVFALFTALVARPWFAAAGALALWAILVLINNAKMHALREPFVIQDVGYFVDALRHPRLYLPFLGWGRLLLAVAAGAAAIGLGLRVELPLAGLWRWDGVGGLLLALAGVGGAALRWGHRHRPPVRFEPRGDVKRLGLVASLWCYAWALLERPRVQSPFASPPKRATRASLPHLVAVQSESFFDPRPLFAGIKPDVLAQFDRTAQAAVMAGQVRVPAWGANTVRSEFAFLSGLSEEALGVHRFHPYWPVTRGWSVETMASYLQALGYRTVCLHPYEASFYLRDRVYPRVGFDVFEDIRCFADAPRFGPYVADAALAERVAQLLAEAGEQPLFVFVITMENHGPLHWERVAAGDIEALYDTPPPTGCDDLTVYLRHLRHADAMLGRLCTALEACGRPASLCWFGDHVPIMPRVYERFGTPEGQTPYLCWANRHLPKPPPPSVAAPRALHELGAAWLGCVGLMRGTRP